MDAQRIREAIERSRSHNECVELTADMADVLAVLTEMGMETDWCKLEDTVDVWAWLPTTSENEMEVRLTVHPANDDD